MIFMPSGHAAGLDETEDDASGAGLAAEAVAGVLEASGAAAGALEPPEAVGETLVAAEAAAAVAGAGARSGAATATPEARSAITASNRRIASHYLETLVAARIRSSGARRNKGERRGTEDDVRAAS
jgi:hypothetical protein